jgi:glucose-6-phosphate 1-dehydrogenase
MSNRCESHVFVVFGGTGDLMGRKLLPALAHLKKNGLRDVPVHVLGVARDPGRDEDSFREWAASSVRDAGLDVDADWCGRCVHYQTIRQQSSEDFAVLRERVERIEKEHDLPGNRLLYLALPPAGLERTIEGLGSAGLNRGLGWTRLVVEKPFGRNLESAVQLNRVLHECFDEEQVYRIDHYLGKETVQNLLVFRFANPLFESVWNRDRIRSVEIVVAERLGVGSRAGYYDRSGALRDMVQNHLTQLLCLTAMEVPATFEADSIRDEKVKVLRSIQPIRGEDVVFGQYTAGSFEGESSPGYLEEEDVPADSRTETFVALRLEIANWRWQGVPFHLRTGKRLRQRLTRIRVRFRRPPVSLFQPFTQCRLSSNELIIILQPDEGFDLRFEVKAPGQGVDMRTEGLRFRYAEAFGPLPDAYETLLMDAIAGDQTLFVRGDEAEAAWKLFNPLLDREPEIHPYAAGTWGPQEAGFFD